MHRISIHLCHIVVLLLTLCLSSGCKREDQQAALRSEVPETYKTRIFLTESIKLQSNEIATGALPLWRQFAALKPSLLILSGDPMLTPTPEPGREKVANLLKVGSNEELVARSRPWTADPLLLPTMTIDAALRAGWFAQCVWALPVPDPNLPLSADTFLNQMHEGGFMAKGDGVGFKVVDQRLRGTVRNTPLIAAALVNVPTMPGPTIVHIDLSYFQMLYKNERLTPILPMLIDTLKALRIKQIPVLAVTFSQGHLDQRMPLDLRVVSEILAWYIEHPENLDKAVPAHWQQWSSWLAARDEGNIPKAKELVSTLDRALPQAAWPKFLCYQTAVAAGNSQEALNCLSQAVRLDRAYALEYLALAGLAVDSHRKNDALNLIGMAGQELPGNLNIKLIQLELEMKYGKKEKYEALLGDMVNRPWSTLYYPETRKYLSDLTN